MNNRSKAALDKFDQGYNCAQATILGFVNDLNMKEEDLTNLALSLGGGVGRKQKLCGAVNGGAIAISLLVGKEESLSFPEKKAKASAKTNELLSKVEETYGGLDCLDLVDGCDFSTEEGQARFTKDKIRQKCNEYVEFIVNTIETMILED